MLSKCVFVSIRNCIGNLCGDKVAQIRRMYTSDNKDLIEQFLSVDRDSLKLHTKRRLQQESKSGNSLD